jgi:hypothetical protein
VKLLLTAALIIALALFVGILERESMLIGEALLKDPTPFGLSQPLPCDAIVAQRGAGESWISKCYMRSDK